jgi:hypothetical protein
VRFLQKGLFANLKFKTDFMREVREGFVATGMAAFDKGSSWEPSSAFSSSSSARSSSFSSSSSLVSSSHSSASSSMVAVQGCAFNTNSRFYFLERSGVGKGPAADVTRFLNRLLAFSLTVQQHLFDLFMACVAEEVKEAKANGKYKGGNTDVPGSAVVSHCEDLIDFAPPHDDDERKRSDCNSGGGGDGGGGGSEVEAGSTTFTSNNKESTSSTSTSTCSGGKGSSSHDRSNVLQYQAKSDSDLLMLLCVHCVFMRVFLLY